MEYIVNDFIFWVLVVIFGGLVVVIFSKGVDWVKEVKDLSANVKENKKHLEELERKFEDAFGVRRL